MNKNYLFIGIAVVVVVLAFVFFSFGSERNLDSRNAQSQNGNTGAVGVENSWMDYELEDVLTGEKFRISDFQGRNVLLESFAVWCPTCTKQQEEVKKLHEIEGYSEDEVVSISLDTDPNEDAEKVRSHANSKGFDWIYSISAVEMTELLRAEFGNSIISAPSAPVVLICPDGSFRKLGGTGARSADKLIEEIERGC